MPSSATNTQIGWGRCGELITEIAALNPVRQVKCLQSWGTSTSLLPSMGSAPGARHRPCLLFSVARSQYLQISEFIVVDYWCPVHGGLLRTTCSPWLRLSVCVSDSILLSFRLRINYTDSINLFLYQLLNLDFLETSETWITAFFHFSLINLIIDSLIAS